MWIAVEIYALCKAISFKDNSFAILRSFQKWIAGHYVQVYTCTLDLQLQLVLTFHNHCNICRIHELYISSIVSPYAGVKCGMWSVCWGNEYLLVK